MANVLDIEFTMMTVSGYCSNQRDRRGVLVAVVDEQLVRLVEDQKRVARGAPLDDLRQLRLADHRAGGIARRVEDHAARALARHRLDVARASARK